VSQAARAAFAGSVACLAEPALTGLSDQLGCIGGLGAAECAVILDGTRAALCDVLLRKVSRVLVLELNIARVTGKLTAGDPQARWSQFLKMSERASFWESLSVQYPAMPGQVRAVVAGRCAAAAAIGRRLAADRHELVKLLGCEPGELTGIAMGAGDSHRGGQTVTVLELGGGPVVYKPRSVRVDEVLSEFLAAVLGGVAGSARIRVPEVVARQEYGWAEYIAHRYCAGPAELSQFYRGIGHWLGVMCLLGGSDLHAENVIACGPVPVVVDCETLFTPPWPVPPSGFGLAVDRASELVRATVLRTGMLPSRGLSLGWRGVDISAAGSLRAEQPVTDIPVIIDAGTDRARIGYQPAQLAAGTSHPSPEPVLAAHWDQVIAGFDEVTHWLRERDRRGELAPMLAWFADCPVRTVLRSTEAYAEIARMLWHPVSLHDPAAARDRAAGLLEKMAGHLPGAPSDPQVIAGEVTDLLAGDIPFFVATPRRGLLAGPGHPAGTPAGDLTIRALDQWRHADFTLDRQVIQAALVSAYLNDGWLPASTRMPSGQARSGSLDQRRRGLAAALIGRVRDTAISAEDGTVTWIAPALLVTGWAVRPLTLDLYGGLPGLAVLLAAYQREHAAGRADEVGGLGELLSAVLRTVRTMEDALEHDRLARPGQRPVPTGGYIGLGSQIWSWLALHSWKAAGPDGLDRARALAATLPAASSDQLELMTGLAGAIVPLLQLAVATGQEQWLAQAADLGQRICAAARWQDGTACWPTRRWPRGLGGMAHGASGIGWALARLGLATGDSLFVRTARAAFAYEQAQYRPGHGWLDLREPDENIFPAAWCHGAVGIGISAADLSARGWADADVTIGRAAAVAHRDGLGWSHTLCHGDLGCWELLAAATTAGRAPAGLLRTDLDAHMITSIERNGPRTGSMARNAYSPGLMAGQGGIAYQLLRMNPQGCLPSLLTLGDPGVAD
jgi:type 2 lantibiotic biosynthesis protein LanM